MKSYRCKMNEENKHFVFVYGTLKPGEYNHHLISEETFGKSNFRGIGVTLEKWPLVIAGRYNTPYLLDCKGKGKVS